MSSAGFPTQQPSGLVLAQRRAEFRNPSVLKGRLTNVRTRFFREFMFNPNDVRDSRSFIYGSHQIPGASHPVYQAGSGGERIITFTLYLDGDRGRLVERAQGIVSNDFEGSDSLEFVQGLGSLDVSKEINWYRSFTYPVRSEEGLISEQAPNRAVFSMGTFYKAVEVIVETADIEFLAWTPNMEPLRVNIPIVLKEYRRRNQFASDIFQEGVSPAVTSPLFPDESTSFDFTDDPLIV